MSFLHLFRRLTDQNLLAKIAVKDKDSDVHEVIR